MKVISGKKLLQILFNQVWKVVRIKGSHFRLKKNNDSISLLVHGNYEKSKFNGE